MTNKKTINKIINGLIIFESLPIIYLILLAIKIVPADLKVLGIFSIPLIVMIKIPIIPILVIVLSIICKRKLITIIHIIMTIYFISLYF